MPAKSKVVKKKIGKNAGGSSLDNPEIIEMFNQMIGASNVDISICYPQYCKIRDNLKRLRTACETVTSAELFGDTADFAKYIKQIDADMNRYGTMDLTGGEVLEYEKLPEKTQTKFTENYKGLKECDSVLSAIGTANNLHPYIDSIKKCHYGFIEQAVGDFNLFEFSSINLKYEFLETPDMAKKTLMTLLAKFYEVTIEIYRECRKPSIDVEKFTAMIRDLLKGAKKHPELHRLDKAFKALEGSMDLFKDNFGEYYRDFVQSKNPGCIMQNFVIDVSKNGNYDFQTLAQLKKVVNHFQKVSRQQNIKDPKVKTMLDEVQKNFSKLDAHISNLKQ